MPESIDYPLYKTVSISVWILTFLLWVPIDLNAVINHDDTEAHMRQTVSLCLHYHLPEGQSGVVSKKKFAHS